MRNSFPWILTIVAIIAFAVRGFAEVDPPTRGSGGEGRIGAIPAIRLEAPNDPPGEPATHVQAPAAVRTRGSFVSTQVNVTFFGGDVMGDAANEPSIAIDPTNPDIMVIGWRQFDTIASNFREAGWSHSTDRGLTWSSLSVIQNNVFQSDPVLDADADGNIYYYSLSTLTSVEMFKSSNGGLSWTGPVPGFGGDKAWMVIDRTGGIGHGNIYAKWQTFFNCCGPNTFTRSTDGGASFMSPVSVPLGPSFGTVAVGPDGEVYVAGIEAVVSQNFNSIVVAKSTDAQDPFVIPTFPLATQVDLGGAIAIGDGPNPVGLLGQVWVAVDHSDGPSRGNVYLLASVDPPGSDPLDVMFSRSTDGGVTWSPPIRINDDPAGSDAWQWFGTLSVAPSGRIDVIWNDTRNTPGFLFSELHFSFSADGGDTWSENLPVSPSFNSHLGFPSQDKLGDYYDMISDNIGVNIAYAATFNGGQDVYFLRFDVDCNGNGIFDQEEVADGITPDCNGNGIPDDCDVDCQENGIPDDCDVDPADPDGDGEVSLDENGNGVPDECEANAPLPADPPNDRKKNRYISLNPNNPGKPVKLEVTVTASLPHPDTVGSSWCESARCRRRGPAWERP